MPHKFIMANDIKPTFKLINRQTKEMRTSIGHNSRISLTNLIILKKLIIKLMLEGTNV